MTDDNQTYRAAEQIIAIVAEAIRELGSVPSGHLYASLMGHMSLTTYQSIITILRQRHLITERNHLLIWIGNDDSAA